MRRTNGQKGITLVALIITIIILLILAVVAISAVTGDGIINHAKNARTEYGKAQDNEQSALDNYISKIEENLPGGNGGGGSDTTPAATIEEAQQDSMLTKTVNSDVKDKYNNKITIPAGFKVLVDGTTTYTSETIDVTKGIVITDGTNEFVWIPVGESITNGTKTVPITLGRYVFTSAGAIDTALSKTEPGDELKTSSSSSYNYTEGLKNSSTANAHALDIEAFRTSATQKGGYYLARYEARVANYDTNNITTSNSNSETNWTGYVAEEGRELKLVSKADAQVWNYVTQKKASELSRNMYTNKPFTSDLINSYAWDTAIVFLQEFDDRTDKTKPYSKQNSLNSSLSNTGTTADKICNIYDMASNCWEWSTETYSIANRPCVYRGGHYYSSYGYTSSRGYGSTTNASDYNSFRPLLYVAL